MLSAILWFRLGMSVGEPGPSAEVNRSQASKYGDKHELLSPFFAEIIIRKAR